MNRHDNFNIEDYLDISIDISNHQKEAYELLTNHTTSISNKISLKEIFYSNTIDEVKLFEIRKEIKKMQYEFELLNNYNAPNIHLSAHTYYEILKLIDVKYICVVNKKLNLFGIDVELIKGYDNYEITIGVSLNY